MGSAHKLVTLTLFSLLLVLPISTFAQMQVKLLENERYSPFDAYAILELTTAPVLTTSKLDASIFNISVDRFLTSKNSVLDSVKQGELGIMPLVEVKTNKSEIVNALEWRSVDTLVLTCPNKTKDDCYNSTVKGEESYPVQHIRNFVDTTWEPLDKITLKPNTKYRVKIEAHNLDKGLNYDWVPTLEGISYKQWAWWNNTWTYKAKIQINSTVASTLTYFPARLVVDTSALIAAGKMNGTCKDLRIVDSSENYLLAFEIENSTCNTTFTTLWFALNLTNGIGAGQANATAYLYYGSNIVADAQTPHTLWNQSGYIRVYHFGETTLGNSAQKAVEDSSQYADHAMTGSAAPAPFQNATSKFGYSLNYGATRNVNGKFVNFTNPNIFSSATATFEIWSWDWIPGTGSDAGLMSSYALVASPYGSTLKLRADTVGGFAYNQDSALITAAGLSSKTWTLTTFVNNGSTNGAIYVNGTLKASGTTGTSNNGHDRIAIGAGDGFERTSSNSNSWAGFIDEARVSTATKSADWIKANYGHLSSLEAESNQTISITVTPANYTLNMSNSASKNSNITISVSGAVNLTLNATYSGNFTVFFNATSFTNMQGIHKVNVVVNSSYNVYTGQHPIKIWVNSSTNNAPNSTVFITANVTFATVCTSGFAYSHIRTGSPLYAGDAVSLGIFYANEYGIPLSATTCRLTIIDSNGVIMSNLSMPKMSSGLFAQNYTFNDTGDYYLMSNCECESTIGSDASVLRIGTLKDVVKAIVKYEDTYKEQYDMPKPVDAPVLSVGWFNISLGAGILAIIGLLLYFGWSRR